MPKILLVDDDEPLRCILRVVLEQANCTVTEASSGEAATAFLKRDCPDILITDMVMPGLEGLDIIRKMRLINPETKIIAMSGASRIVKADYLEMASALGADVVLVKPFSPVQFLAALEQVLGPLTGQPRTSSHSG